MNIRQQIESHINEPAELERLYRESPEEFRECFSAIYNTNQDSVILSVWYARFFYEKNEEKPTLPKLDRSFEIILIIFLSLIGGTYAKIPAIIDSIDSGIFYLRNPAFFILPIIAFYFVLKTSPNKKKSFIIWGTFLIAILFINLMPTPEKSDTIVLSCIHIPFFLWTIVGFAYTGDEFQNPMKRMDYLKYNGEMFIYTAIILIGGMILTGLTLGLFSVIKIDIFKWYTEYVVVYGIVASPIVATYLVEQRNHTHRFAPVIAKVFSPLFLITLIIFLLTIVIQQKSPYTDRDFLIVFNIMLLIILAITIFSISERQSTAKETINDYLNVLLIIVALAIDAIALSAIIFRLTSYGLTPNRIAVLGANLIIFIHLAGMLFYYIHFLKQTVQMKQIYSWITQYLPTYTVWTAFITFVFPFIYRFK
ncbi:DUF4153 domain-containing protein [Deltaproteobacteria bacterium TL4]